MDTKPNFVRVYCALQECDSCLIHSICEASDADFEFNTSAYNAALDILEKRGYTKWFEQCPANCEEPDCNEAFDTISKPKHYNREDAMESIDEMELIFGREVVKDFCLCNVWKYRYRAADKNGKEDLEKSDWYMKKYKELCDKGYC